MQKNILLLQLKLNLINKLNLIKILLKHLFKLQLFSYTELKMTKKCDYLFIISAWCLFAAYMNMSVIATFWPAWSIVLIIDF